MSKNFTIPEVGYPPNFICVKPVVALNEPLYTPEFKSGVENSVMTLSEPFIITDDEKSDLELKAESYYNRLVATLEDSMTTICGQSELLPVGLEHIAVDIHYARWLAKQPVSYLFHFKSLQQLRTAFNMECLFGMVWNGDNWVEKG